MVAASQERITHSSRRFESVSIFGAVRRVSALGLEIDDRLSALTIGDRVAIETNSAPLTAEVVGVDKGYALALPFGPLTGVPRGAPAKFLSDAAQIAPSDAWLGRVIDGLGRPVDGKGPLPNGPHLRPIKASPPPAQQRARQGGAMNFGVKALDVFTPARIGQRLGVFSGAGVGKSALLGMIARHTASDIAVIALIGERGREVREFLEDHLGADRLARSVVVVATSDEPAMLRREAAYLAMSLAEHFRDEGAHVLCLMDSLTRVVQAQREIGLAAGEPPTAKGYTPSVFSLMPSLIERAGPGLDNGAAGAVSAVFSVLVEGDDHDEPIADAARATLDGHVVLDRRIAERGRMPAIDFLRSVSRAMPGALNDENAALVREIKSLAAAYEDMREVVRIGGYRAGADPTLDRAIAIHDELEEFLAQEINERVDVNEAFSRLKSILEKGDAP